MGLPAYSLNEIACRYGADLIVVGSHGKSLWREGVLGCFTCAVVHHARYPVLLLKDTVDETKERGHLPPCKPLSCSATFSCPRISPSSPRGLRNIWSSGDQRHRQVTLLNALDVPGEEAYPPGYQEIAEGAARDLLEQWKQRLLQAGIPVVNDHFDSGHPHPGHSGSSGIPGYLVNRHGHPGEGIYQGDFPGQRGP